MSINPFSTRFVRPGAIDYHFFDGATVDVLLDALLNSHSRCGAIVGPHGTGKSTLINAIQRGLQEAVNPCTESGLLDSTREHSTLQPIIYRFHNQAPDYSAARLPHWSKERRSWTPSSLILVDGFEQLTLFSKWSLLRSVRRSRVPLLATVHRRTAGLTTIWESSVNETMRRSDVLIEHLLKGQEHVILEQSMQAWHELCQRHPIDIRERLMAMYDWWESRRDQFAAPHTGDR